MVRKGGGCVRLVALLRESLFQYCLTPREKHISAAVTMVSEFVLG